jgi:acetylcholinesterase
MEAGCCHVTNMAPVDTTLSKLVLGRLQVDRARVVAVIFVILLVLPSSHSGRDNLVRNTDKGRVRGIRYYIPKFNKVVNAFLGIPFAKPPLNHLRFRHPEPMDEWQGVRNATKLPKSCFQAPDTFFPGFYGSEVWNPTTPVSEDCLYLNVWVPRSHRRTKKSAVMVWIYGGGFYSGTTTLNLYDGKLLAALNDVIVVSISYRVGALGFLNLGHHEAPGNAGMFDQVMALQWVQRNIHDFGGDPKNVTLFGESAGGVSVSLHLLSPLSQEYFHRAIMQSGAAITPWATLTEENGKMRSLELATSYLKCPETDDMAAMVRCLREINPDVIVAKQWVVRGISQFPFVPIVDGSFLTEDPMRSMERRSFKKCPILIGSNSHEGSWFIIYELKRLLSLDKRVMRYEDYVNSMHKLHEFYPQWPQLNNKFGRDAIVFQYMNAADPTDQLSNLNGVEQSVGDRLYLCPVNDFATYYAAAGENVYNYYLTQRYSTNPWPSWMGVLHGDDIFWVFGELLKDSMNYTRSDQELSLKMMQYWTSFAKHG